MCIGDCQLFLSNMFLVYFVNLQTFHYAGVSAKNVTLGVPRLKEIINVAKTPKTPGLTVYIAEEFSGDRNVAELVVSMLEFTVLKDIVKRTEIWYDPDIKNTVVQKDREFVKDYYDFAEKTEDDINRMSSWVLRMELDKDVVFGKKGTKIVILLIWVWKAIKDLPYFTFAQKLWQILKQLIQYCIHF